MNTSVEIKIEVKVEYVTFNGDNVDEVIHFVKKYKLYDPGEKNDDFYTVRPDWIPNLDEDDLLKWWESTGEIKPKSRTLNPDDTYNTHNINNMPLWRKDELLEIDLKGSQEGYMSRDFLKKGDTYVVYTRGRKHFFKTTATTEDEIKEEVLDYISWAN